MSVSLKENLKELEKKRERPELLKSRRMWFLSFLVSRGDVEQPVGGSKEVFS